ncbi:MAG: BMP family lipoprotein [Candidatus Nanopelagicus sp.]
MKKSFKFIVAVAATSLVASVAVTPAAHGATKQKVCVALDTAGINDKSFNQSSYEGAKMALQRGFASSIKYAPAKSNADYAPNITKFIAEKCTMIIGVGFLLGDAIAAAAKANPNVKFGFVDGWGLGNNVKAITYKTDENSFIVGYMAAAMSKTGKVGTYGGLQIPTVTIFMEGFANGVAHYNLIKNKNVRVLGWNTETQTGTFLGGFDDTTKALQTSISLEQQGADFIFPVAGGMQATTAANSQKTKKSSVIWVDAKVMNTGKQYANVTPVSVVKGLAEGVFATIKEAHDGKFTSKAYVGTMANKGVSIALTPAWNNKIPAKLKAEINQLSKDIAAGRILALDPIE